jgi:hypothetical protein
MSLHGSSSRAVDAYPLKHDDLAIAPEHQLQLFSSKVLQIFTQYTAQRFFSGFLTLLNTISQYVIN